MNKELFEKVSVLIPAFNEEKYILKALEALVLQDYENFEVIVINNASTDKTEDIVNLFIFKNKGNLNIQLVNEQRKGTNYARECGRKHASGKIIAQVDADCIPYRSWICDGVKILKGKAIAVTGPYDYYDTFYTRRKITLLVQMFVYPFINYLIQVFKRGAILIGGNSFIYADVLNNTGGYNIELTFYGDDIDLAAKVAKIGYVLYSSKLIIKTSSRRFKAIGFKKVQRKYRKSFWNLIVYKKINAKDSYELVHPR